MPREMVIQHPEKVRFYRGLDKASCEVVELERPLDELLGCYQPGCGRGDSTVVL